MITYDNKLYKVFKSFAKLFERKRIHMLEYIPAKKYDIILCGCDRMGKRILKTLKQLKKSVLVVDFNPEIIKELIEEKQACIYGDIGDLEVIRRLPLKQISLIISTIPDVDDNKLILRKAKAANRRIVAFVTASMVDEALELYKAKADYVILPKFLSGERVSMLIEDLKGNLKNILKYKIKHMGELKKVRH